ncbi:MAG TPA: NrfD/PsrC family molybdoenzyme membrane anchor subunit, partial [Tepidisphaeraceae bacterium]|nr:NrfD/PsrC family molybdoenzyme membrane anchor subunit [Tepidisphaeraceae bacterium]
MAEDRKDAPYDAPWAQNLRHRPDPNRVSSLQTPTPGQFDRPQPLDVRLPSDQATAQHRPLPVGAARDADPQSNAAPPSYYDIPMLKQPVWKWQIATYFYLGGLSAGAYLLSRVADRAGGDKHRNVSRIGAYVAMATLVPCPPLLIWDLGDPKRFHHMLRVWKPSTPMNLGTWSIVAYSGMAAYEVVRQYLTERENRVDAASLGAADRNKLLQVMNNGVLLALHDAAGIPFSLMVAGYTGVLLSCTANPLWCKNPHLGPLFSASAVSTGAEAISLALDLLGDQPASQSALQNIDTAAHVAELACMAGFSRFAGEKADPLRRGLMKKHHLFSLGAIVGAEVLKRIPVDNEL